MLTSATRGEALTPNPKSAILRLRVELAPHLYHKNPREYPSRVQNS